MRWLQAVEKLRAECRPGVLVTLAGARALRFSPPLIITREQVDEGVAIVESVVGKLS